jgi:hypothetical protein
MVIISQAASMFSSAGMALGEEEDAWWGDINDMQQGQQR